MSKCRYVFNIIEVYGGSIIIWGRSYFDVFALDLVGVSILVLCFARISCISSGVFVAAIRAAIYDFYPKNPVCLWVCFEHWFVIHFWTSTGLKLRGILNCFHHFTWIFLLMSCIWSPKYCQESKQEPMEQKI